MKQKKILSNILLCLIVFASMVFSVNALAQPSVDLGTAANFGVLAATTITNTGHTVIARDLGLSPNDNSSITGFFVIDSGPGIVNGTIHAADSIAAQAQLDLVAAYNDAAGRSVGVVIIPSGELGGLSLTPGLYRSGISSFAISSGDLTLDAKGDANAVFIFQMPSSSLTTISGTHVVLVNKANPCNIFWQVGSSATIGTNSTFEGNILALTSITVTTGANLEGRALARNGATTLDTNSVFLSCENTTPSNFTTLTVTKIVINNNEGTLDAGNFTLLVNGSHVISGIANKIAPGSYIVSEIPVSGYNGTISGDCNSNGIVTLNPGDVKTCTITNNDVGTGEVLVPEFTTIGAVIVLICAGLSIAMVRRKK